MRFWPAVLALLATGCGARAPVAPPVTPHPIRVMSMNQCADQIVLALLPPDRIASVSWLSRDPGGSQMAAEAARVPINHGTAEEVLATRPDLVVMGSYTTPALRAMLTRLGYPMITVDHAPTLDDIRRVTRQIAAATDTRPRAEALIAAMDRKVAELQRHPAPPIRVVAWDRTGFAAAKGSLYETILYLAGADNYMRDPVMLNARKPEVELLLKADPALLIVGGGGTHGPSLGDALTNHRVVRTRWAERMLAVRRADFNCGTPFIADAALRLRDQLRAAGRLR